MKIPETFVIPDFILEMVRVAPEEWPVVTESKTAAARLGELRTALMQPDILAVICELVLQLSTIDDQVDNKRFDGFHDVLNQQQLIGEKRGLRQLFAKLQIIHTELTSKAQS